MESIPSARGSAIHEVFEKITKARLSGESMLSPDQIRQWTVEALNHYPLAAHCIDEIMEIIRRYMIRFPVWLTGEILPEVKKAVDINFEECGYDYPDALFRARLDILNFSVDNKAAHIIDYKSQFFKEDADTVQLGMYAWLVFKTYPFLERVTTQLYFARYGSYSEVYEWTRETLEVVEDNLKVRIEHAESLAEMKAEPSSQCTYCPYLIKCPALAEFINVNPDGSYSVKNDCLKILGDTRKAVQLGGLKIVCDKLSKHCNEELRDHVGTTGPIACADIVYEFRAEEEPAWDKINKSPEKKRSFMEIFKKFGVDALDYMGFSQTFSKGVWMLGNQPLMEELSKAVPKKTTKTFKGWKM
jgi:CRISPR/Cas system-associated exonuclease Cas4 (RecB family)